MTESPETPEPTTSYIDASQLLDLVLNARFVTTSPGSTGMHLTDSHGATYAGRASHVTLLAMLRRDILPQPPASPFIRSRIEYAAHMILLWFTNEHTPPEHAEAFDNLSARETCRMVVDMVNRDISDVARHVGPQSLPLHTAYLLGVAGQAPSGSTWTAPPQVIDPGQGGGKLGWCGVPRVEVTTRNGAGTVPLHVELTVTEELRWNVRTTVDVPAEDLNDLLRYAGSDLGSYLSHNSTLIDGCLDRRNAEQVSLHVEAALTPTEEPVVPGDNDSSEPGDESADDATGGAVATITLHYVGRDRDHALTRAPYLDADAAHEAADGSYEGSYEVFTATVEVSAPTLVQMTQNR